MAMYDWNGSGDKDRGDDFIEYHIHQKVSGEKDPPASPRGRKGRSWFGALLCMIGGLVLQALFFLVLGIEVEDIPAIVILVLWLVFSELASIVLGKLGI